MTQENLYECSSGRGTSTIMEKCIDLIQAIGKCKHYGTKYRNNLIREISEITSAIEKLKLIYNISDKDIYNIKNKP